MKCAVLSKENDLGCSMSDVSILTAFGAGVLSFLSPCVLPVYPAFLSYITGVSISELKEEKGLLQRRALFHTICFLIGFSVIYLALGFTSSFLGQFFLQYKDTIRMVGAILMIVFGMLISGVIQPKMLMQNHRFEFQNRPSGYLGSVLIGLAFSAGWTPCMGPTLGYVMTLAATNPGSGMFYMICYILGFAIPFIVLSFFIGRMNWLKRHANMVSKVGGLLMILMGFVLLLDWLPALTSFFSRFIPSFLY